MSHPARQSPRKIDDLAATWVGRRDAGLTSAEAAELAAWRAADPAHAAALSKFESVWSAADRPKATGAGEAIKQDLANRARQRRRRRSVAGAGLVACCLLGLGLWVSVREKNADALVEAHTAFLGPLRQTLPDGSIAEYSPGTRLAIDFSGAIRRVAFARGEAHFEVVPNTRRPFVVTAGGLAVRAVGTAFAVQVGNDATAVLVTSGRVAVTAEKETVASPAPDTCLAFVDAGRSIEVHTPSAGSAPAVVELSAAESAERLAWRKRRVEFSSVPLAEVVAIVNRHNRTQFVVDDPALQATRLSGVFWLEAPEELARLLESSFPLTIDRRDANRIVLRPRR